MAVSVASPLHDDAISHYQIVAPIMEQLFGKIPVIWTVYPHGEHSPPEWHAKYFGHYSKLSSEHIQHLVSVGAREFYSWSPTVADPARARFMRLLVEKYHGLDPTLVKEAALAVRSMLAEDGREAIALLDGLGNITLWVPLSDAPTYDVVRTWCHAFAQKVVERHPTLVSTLPNTHSDGRAHLHVSTNAEGRFSIIPYSMREKTGRVATPIRWPELGDIDVHGVTITDFPHRLKKHGEIFGEELALIHARPLDVQAPVIMSAGIEQSGAILLAATRILGDGKPWTAAEILAEALKLKLIRPTTTTSNIYIDLSQAIEREREHGRKPQLVQDPDRRFRINEPVDLWPDVTTVSTPPPSAQTQALVEQLQATSHGSDPTAFEVAVCDAFSALGFLATHVGNVGNPDGYVDAPLGVLGYRAMLECKTGPNIVGDPNVSEAAKFRDGYGAQYCALVGPGFGNRFDVTSELQAHGVSAWTVSDLVTLLTIGANPAELRDLFTPGFAADRVNDVLWARNHGRAKRVRIIVESVRSAGWAAQCAAAEAGSITDAPRLTEDAAMLMVDQELAAQGAHVSCSREDVKVAFEHLTSPLVAAAAWVDDTRTAIVLTAPGVSLEIGSKP